jgi:hypothetical protein
VFRILKQLDGKKAGSQGLEVAGKSKVKKFNYEWIGGCLNVEDWILYWIPKDRNAEIGKISDIG